MWNAHPGTASNDITGSRTSHGKKTGIELVRAIVALVAMLVISAIWLFALHRPGRLSEMGAELWVSVVGVILAAVDLLLVIVIVFRWRHQSASRPESRPRISVQDNSQDKHRSTWVGGDYNSPVVIIAALIIIGLLAMYAILQMRVAVTGATSTLAYAPVPVPSSTPTATLTPNPSTGTWTPTSILPTYTPTAVPSPTSPLITDAALRARLGQAIEDYRTIERQALRTLDPLDAINLPNHATGEALEKLRLTMALLRDAGARQELTTPQLDLEWAAWGDDRQQSVVVSVREKYTLRAYRSGADGPQLLYEQPPFDGRIIYRLILSESRWKVERIRPQTSSGP